MANTKISELPAGVPTLAAEVPFVEGGATKKGVRFAVMTEAQATAGATAPAALTAAGVALDAAGAPLATISRAERDLPVRVATFGNSLSLVAPTYANSNLNPFQAVMPASAGPAAQYQTEGHALGMFYPQARIVAQGGIGGQTLAQMLARDTLSASATRYSAGDILAQSPDVVLLHLPTNDLATVTAGTYTAVLDAAKTAATALIARILASNARVCDYGCPGYSAANANLALIKQAVLEWNAWCRSTLTATFGAQGYAFIDPLNVTHDATGAYLTGMSYDGIHLGGGGKIALARPTAAQLTAWFGQPAKGVFEGNWISNATMANQEANSWGVQAVGFGITAASGTKSNSVVSTQNGVTTQSIEVRGLTDWQSVFVAIPCDLTATATGMTGNLALTSDEFVQLECDVTITSLSAAPVAFNTADVTITLSGAAGGTVLIQQALDATVMPSGTSTVTLHLATPDVAAMGQGGFTASAARVSVYAATVCPDIKVGISAPRLTKARRIGTALALTGAQLTAGATSVLGETSVGTFVNGAGATVMTKSGTATKFPGQVLQLAKKSGAADFSTASFESVYYSVINEIWATGYNIFYQIQSEPILSIRHETNYQASHKNTVKRTTEHYLQLNGPLSQEGGSVAAGQYRPWFWAFAPNDTSKNRSGELLYGFLTTGAYRKATPGAGGLTISSGDDNASGSIMSFDVDGAFIEKPLMGQSPEPISITAATVGANCVITLTSTSHPFVNGSNLTLFSLVNNEWVASATGAVTAVAGANVTTDLNNTNAALLPAAPTAGAFGVRLPHAVASQIVATKLGVGRAILTGDTDVFSIAGPATFYSQTYFVKPGSSKVSYGKTCIAISGPLTDYQILSFANTSQGYSFGYFFGNNASCGFGPGQNTDASFTAGNSVIAFDAATQSVGVGGALAGAVARFRVAGGSTSRPAVHINNQTDGAHPPTPSNGVALYSINGQLYAKGESGVPVLLAS